MTFQQSGAVSVERRRSTRSFTSSDAVDLLATLAIAVALAGVVFWVSPLSGLFGFVLVSAVIFMICYFLRVRRTKGAKQAADRVLTVFVATGAMLAFTPLAMMLYEVIAKGIGGISVETFSKTMEGVDPSAPATQGGALHAIVGSLSQVALASFVCVPFGIATAVYLHEIGGRMTTVVRLLVDAMSGIPSILAGLFIYALWVVGVGAGFSGFAAALALAILMLPTVARTTEEMLRLVDPSLRECSLALGSSQWRTVAQVVLPTARTGIVTAVILGIARIAGETAPLLMTGFGADRNVMPWKAFGEPQSALPLFIYQNLLQDQRQRAWAAALLLIGLVLILFALARFVGRGRKATKR